MSHERLNVFAMLSVACRARFHEMQTDYLFNASQDAIRWVSCRTDIAALPRRQALLESIGALSSMTVGWLLSVVYCWGQCLNQEGGSITGLLWQTISSTTTRAASTEHGAELSWCSGMDRDHDCN